MHLPNAMKVAVGVGRTVVVDDDVHALDIDTATEDIRRYQYTLLKVFEGLVAVDTGGDVSEAKTEFLKATYRSSCCRPEWMLILGKLHETRSLSNSIARATDLTKMTTCKRLSIDYFAMNTRPQTWLNSRVSSRSFNFLFFCASSNLT